MLRGKVLNVGQLAAAAVGVAALGAWSPAQDVPAPGPDDGLRADAVHPNVYLHDSFEAEELIE